MSDRARRDQVKRKRLRERPVRAVDLANSDTYIAQLTSADTALDVRLDALELDARVKGRRSSNQPINDATPTLVVFTAADDFDFTGWHGSDDTFTVPSGQAGLYAVLAHVEFAAPALAGVFLVAITVGGSPITEQVESSTPATVPWSSQLTAWLVLAAGDVLKVRVTQTSGAVLNLQNATFTIVRVAT